MEFDAVLEQHGRVSGLMLPFDAREAFGQPKGTILVSGTIDGTTYRGKLLSRGDAGHMLVVDKATRTKLGFDGAPLSVRVTMEAENSTAAGIEAAPTTHEMDSQVLRLLDGRRSIRSFTDQPIDPALVDEICRAGLAAPTAKNKRPVHLVVVDSHALLSDWADTSANTRPLHSAPCAIVVCGDRNLEGTKELLHADCAAAAQNMLVMIHGLGLGGVWCGVLSGQEWVQQIAEELMLPPKVEPFAVVAFGHPAEQKPAINRWAPGKVHRNRW